MRWRRMASSFAERMPQWQRRLSQTFHMNRGESADR